MKRSRRFCHCRSFRAAKRIPLPERNEGAADRSQHRQAAKLVDNAALSAGTWRDFGHNSEQPTMGAHGRVVGNFVRAGTRRFCGAARDNGLVCSVATGQPPLSDRLRLPLSAPAEQIAYAFPSAASSRSRRPAAQIALVPFSCVAFSPSAVFTFTVASSTAYDPRTTRPLNTVVISLQIIGVATAHPR